MPEFKMMKTSKLVFLFLITSGLCLLFVSFFLIGENRSFTRATIFKGNSLNECCTRLLDTSKCSRHPSWENLLQTTYVTNIKDWSFKTKTICPEFPLLIPHRRRHKLILDCINCRGSVKYVTTNNTSDVFVIPFDNISFSGCLNDVIDNCCVIQGTVVPNVVHYVWYSHKELGFFPFLSFMSVLRFIKPCLIFIHGNYLPYGKYWDYIISIAPNIIHVKRERPTHIFGHKLKFEEHSSDVMRIEALTAYGGIYLDYDEIVLRPLTPLMKYEYTQGHEMNHTMGSQLIMAKRNAEFLRLWYNSYKDDYRDNWGFNALIFPANLAKIKSHLIHVEGYNFTRPSWTEVDLIFTKNYDWSTNYAMHFFIRWYKNETTIENIRQMNTTIGSVSRYVLLGNKELCLN